MSLVVWSVAFIFSSCLHCLYFRHFYQLFSLFLSFGWSCQFVLCCSFHLICCVLLSYRGVLYLLSVKPYPFPLLMLDHMFLWVLKVSHSFVCTILFHLLRPISPIHLWFCSLLCLSVCNFTLSSNGIKSYQSIFSQAVFSFGARSIRFSRSKFIYTLNKGGPSSHTWVTSLAHGAHWARPVPSMYSTNSFTSSQLLLWLFLPIYHSPPSSVSLRVPCCRQTVSIVLQCIPSFDILRWGDKLQFPCRWFLGNETDSHCIFLFVSALLQFQLQSFSVHATKRKFIINPNSAVSRFDFSRKLIYSWKIMFTQAFLFFTYFWHPKIKRSSEFLPRLCAKKSSMIRTISHELPFMLNGLSTLFLMYGQNKRCFFSCTSSPAGMRW